MHTPFSNNSGDTTALPLFRSEAVTASTGTLFGTIRLAQPVAGWLSASMAFLIVIALALFAVLGSVTRKAHVTGITVPANGSATIAATTAGVLSHLYVHEGQHVDSGHPLFELSTERQNVNGELTALIGHQLASRESSLENERRLRQERHREQLQTIRARQQNLAIEKVKIEEEIALALRRQELAQRSVGQYETLRQSGYVSQAQTQQKQEDLLDVTAKLNALERNKVQLDANGIALKSDIAAIESALATDLAQLDRTAASLQQEIAENHSRQSHVITAPQAGTISAIAYSAGQTVTSGQMLATLIPAGARLERNDEAQLEAHLYVPSRTAGFIETGQSVALRYDAFPYQKFGLQQGTVIEVGSTPFAPAELPAHLATTLIGNAQLKTPGTAAQEALYRIKVRLSRQTIDTYGQTKNLKAGMTLSADVKQDRRAIWEWVAEPLLAVRQM